MRFLKFKLALGFFISLSAIITAGYFAYQSFNKLIDSVYALAAPDETVNTLHEVSNKLISSENDMRIYTMTADTNAYQEYKDHVDSVTHILDSLKIVTSQEVFQHSIFDTLSALLSRRVYLMNDLVALKASSRSAEVANTAMDRISDTYEPQPLPIKTESNNKADELDYKISTTRKTIPETDINSDRRKLFGNNKKDNKNQSALSSNATIENDSISPYISQIDDITVLTNSGFAPEDVREILSQLYKLQKINSEKITNQELAILASDKVIMENVKHIITTAEVAQQNKRDKNVISATAQAQDSSKIIFGISILSLIAGLIFMAIIIHDINKSNKAKQELIMAWEKAEYLAKAKEQFLANMSHEIRTPLNAIIGFSEQLKGTDLKVTQKDYVKALQGAGDHLLNIVNDILDLSKIEAGKLVFQRNIFSMNTIINEVRQIMKVKADEKKILLDYIADEGGDIIIRGDDFRLKQVLFNLIGNAIKFTHLGYVKIVCSSARVNETINFTIEIIDSGIGIAKDKLDHIFEDFSQADIGTTKKYGGTGLGLAISKKIIEMQNGTITVSSEDGIGSVFTISISYKTATEREINKSKIQHKKMHTIHESDYILVVDDEQFNLALANVVLQKFNVNYKAVSSAAEAMALIEKKEIFTAVFADLHMPQEDGFSLAKKIHIAYPSLPIIALTANVMHDEDELINQAGFCDILTKPYKESDFIQMINKWSKRDGKAIKTEPEKIGSFIENNMSQFSLDEILLFTDNDPDLTRTVIHSFIDSNKINLQTLNNAFQISDIALIRNTAHKMLPGYTHFKIQKNVALLKKLELLQDISLTNKEELTLLQTESYSIFNEMLKLEIMQEQDSIA